MSTHIVLFSLDELRSTFPSQAAAADPRHDTGGFRAFRAVLLDALAKAAVAPAAVSMWWEGGFNGYALAVAVEPGESVPALDEVAGRACPLEGSRLAPARPDRQPMGIVHPGWHTVARDDSGAVAEAPFGAPTGHFGAPGMRRVFP